MSDLINQQLAAFGVAQVIVILKLPAAAASVNRPSAALAAAMPVRASRTNSPLPSDVIMGLAQHFHFQETAMDSGLAAAATRVGASAGAAWFKKAASASNPTPPMRYFPNLGVMFGSCDRAGLTALRQDNDVADVIAPPVLSLIRPVSVTPVDLKAGAAAATAIKTSWGIKRLKAHKLHQQKDATGRFITGEGIIVGHLDTGVDGKHPALKSAIHAFAEFDAMGFEVNPAPEAHDTDEHGTHTAGTIAGRTAKKRAIGVAPGAKLASAIVIEGGNATARVLAGMDWVIEQGARILSMSLGFRGFTDDFLTLTQLLRSKGVLPVFAVGNEGPGTSRSPGNYEEALSIGAMDRSELVADFSSSRLFQRPKDPIVPDLVAPGVAIISAMPGGGYQSMDGSSMATPHIAGLAALLMQARPTKTIDEIEKAIFDSCTPLAGEATDRQNRGVPDAVKALSFLP